MNSVEYMYSTFNGHLPTMSLLEEKDSPEEASQYQISNPAAMKYKHKAYLYKGTEKLIPTVPVILLEENKNIVAPNDDIKDVDTLNNLSQSNGTEKSTIKIFKRVTSSPSSTPPLHRKVLNGSIHETGDQVSIIILFNNKLRRFFKTISLYIFG